MFCHKMALKQSSTTSIQVEEKMALRHHSQLKETSGECGRRRRSRDIWPHPAGVAVLVILPQAIFATSSQAIYFPTADNATSLERLLDCCNEINGSLDGNMTGGGGVAASNRSLVYSHEEEQLSELILMVVLSIFLGLMILVTVIGNVFVIAAILLERNLQNVANYLIVSLAVADLMVACLVMPLGAVYVISNNWIMGPELCDMWTSIDVLCCTASILHLVAIALDRYYAVTNVDYIHTRNSNRIGLMIIVVWTIALVVSLAPQIPQFKDPDYLRRIEEKKQCLVSQDVKYQIFATSSTFYVPLLVIFILYWKIFQTARKRIRRRRELKGQIIEKVEKTNNNSKTAKGFLTKRRFLRMKKSNEGLKNALVMMEGQSTTTMEIVEEEGPTEAAGSSEETTAFTITKPVKEVNNVSPEKSSTNNGSASHQSHISDISHVEVKEVCPDKLIPCSSRREKKESLEAKRERKAAKTLAIITGAFVMCWLPFFILALVMPLCGDSCTISEFIMSFSLWLGYFNSTLNPVIYTIFNPEFRQAFKRILCGAHRAGGGGRSYRGKIR